MSGNERLPSTIQLSKVSMMGLELLQESEARKPREIDYDTDPTPYEIAIATQWEKENSALRLLLGIWLTKDALEQIKTNEEGTRDE